MKKKSRAELRDEWINDIRRSLRGFTKTGVASVDQKLERELKVGDLVINTYSFRRGKITAIKDNWATVKGLGQIPINQLRIQ